MLSHNWECAYCGRPITFRALAVEAVGAACALLIYHFGLGPTGPWMAMLVAWVFLLITVIDLEHRLILHVVSLPAAAVLGLISAFDPARGPAKTLIGGAAGLGIVLILFLFGQPLFPLDCCAGETTPG